MSEDVRPPLQRGRDTEAGALMPWKIVEIARAKGEFRVSWRYRDERLMRRCHRLCKQKWLKRIYSGGGEDVFVYRQEPKQ